MAHGKLKAEDMPKRDHLETVQAVLCNLTMDIEEILLRNRQAMRRSSLVADVLDPAIERLMLVQEDLRFIQEELRQAWIAGQARRWKGDEDHGTE